ncbi:MAG: glycine/sarcosine/betaine reductase component B subunit [Gudongella sp.]|nr:glycine/sarcosine/betaine reductase component B subunit [Gudongella sp.]
MIVLKLTKIITITKEIKIERRGHMKLELGKFNVKDVLFGEKTFFKDGVLTINKDEAISFIKEDEHITDVDIVIAKPGENTRIVPVKEAVEPRIRPDGRAVFPGVTGELAMAGEGRVHALKGCSVLGVGMHWGSFGDGLIDMGGEGAKYTLYSQLINICIVADTDEEKERHEQQKKNTAIRMASHKFAEYLGETVKELEPEEIDIYELDPVTKRDEKVDKLPSVVLVMQPQSQMEELGYNDLVYGWDMNKYVPSFMNPNEVLDGALISGSFMPSSSKWSTYDFQNFPTIRELYKEHGKSLNFLGVIMSNLNVSLEQKIRSSIFVAQMAKSLGADGAIVTEEGYGNPDADYILCLAALEDVGVKTVGISNECTGRDGASQPLVTLDVKANALVSTGNVSEIIKLPPADKVIGELESLARDGLSGGWPFDEFLGSSVKEDGSIIMENNGMFCGDMIAGWSTKTMKEF